MGNELVPRELLAAARWRDPYHSAIEALEVARRAVCTYMGPTCDCKWGLIPSDDPAEVVPLKALNCKHSGHCEHTGCPELRSLIGRIRRAQRAWWAARSDYHTITTHGQFCCEKADIPGWTPESEPVFCGGTHYCPHCTSEADRAHGLLPPLAEPA